jgi:ubiquinone/menaquinone biosynthesis C-methylase UbiE
MPSFIGWVPTEQKLIEGFFELAPVTSQDVVYDLGCGDGRLLFAALEKGAGRVVGVELNPELVMKAYEAANTKGVTSKATFVLNDVLDANLDDATVVFYYLMPSASTALKPKFEKELRPGTRVVTESFPVHGWKPVKTHEISNGTSNRYFYLYVMPPVMTREGIEEY